jgi:hypothetical protein
MGAIGFALLPGISLSPGGWAGVAAASAGLWLCLCPLVHRQSLGTAVTVGLLSPLIVIAVGSPLAIMIVLFNIRYWVIFPIGALTGVLVWACLSIGRDAGQDNLPSPPAKATNEL